MKKLLFIPFIFFSLLLSATNYHVKIGGSDAANGDITHPWATITKVNTFWAAGSFVPGDSINFYRGDTFYGTITATESGSSGSPIIVGAYGTGTKPIITGFTTITGWTNLGGGIYSKTVSAESSTTNIVTVNGVNTAMGRWPNTGYMTYESYTGNTSITDNQLTGTPNWTGAELVLRRNQWTLNTNLITNHTGSVITYTFTDPCANGGTNGYGYFIQNDIKTLDVLGEWYYNGTTFYMYFGANNPNDYTVKISTLDKLFAVGASGTHRDYITIDGLTFEGSSVSSVYLEDGSSNIIIQNCTIRYGGQKGIYAFWQIAHMLVDNNIIDQINGIATHIRGGASYTTISNNTITNIGLQPGGGDKAGCSDNLYDAIVCESTSNTIIEHNTIQHVGHSGIRVDRDSLNMIRNNIVSDWGLVRSDCGAIYTWTVNKDTISGNIIINSNQVLDGLNNAVPLISGIYLDDYTTNSTISNNSVYNVIYGGISIRSSQNTEVSNNTVYACSYAQLAFGKGGSGAENSGLNIHDNIFIAKMAGATAFPWTPSVLEIESFFNTPAPLGIFDRNYYARPIDDDDVFRRYYPTDPWYGVGLTLSQWQAYSGQDVNSHKSPQAITTTDDLQFEYNATTTAKTVT